MASNLKYSTANRQAQAAADVDNIGASPVLRIYNGTQPAGPDTAVTSQTLLAQGTLPGTPLTSAGGVISKAGTWTLTGQSGAGGGTAGTWFRLLKSDGTTAVKDGTFGVSSGDFDMEADVNSIATGQTVNITAFTLTKWGA